MSDDEMNFEEFEAQTLHDDYSEELWKDRQKRRGHYWKIEDEGEFLGYKSYPFKTRDEYDEEEEEE